MCLLICGNKKVQNLDWLSNGFDNNSHGAGFVFAHKKRLHLRKGFFKFEDFLKAYKEMPDDAPCLIHFRLATGGKLNEANCHPFSVSNNLAFAHNGVFFNVKDDDNFSDTYYFNQSIIQPIFAKNPHAIYTEGARALIEEFIGRGNKVAFINNYGRIVIMNEKMGDYEGETWFSNGSYKYGRKCNFHKSGKTVKVYSQTNHGASLVSHPTPHDYLKEIFQTHLIKERDEKQEELKELMRLQAVGD